MFHNLYAKCVFGTCLSVNISGRPSNRQRLGGISPSIDLLTLLKDNIHTFHNNNYNDSKPTIRFINGLLGNIT